MVLEILHDTFWGSQAAAAGTGLLFAMAACIWARRPFFGSFASDQSKRRQGRRRKSPRRICTSSAPCSWAPTACWRASFALCCSEACHDTRPSSRMPWCAELEHGCLGSAPGGPGTARIGWRGICRSANGRSSMTGPAGNMTETPDPGRRLVWTHYLTS
jgi:hypothetical protein